MSYANGTTFYNLPQTVGTDKRDWFDTNEAFAEIDAALHSAVEGQATDAEAIATINSKLVDDEANITALQGTTATHTSQITTLANAVTENANNITDVRNDCEDMICAFNEASATSSHVYNVDEYFIYNNVLYKATTSIAIGDTIVPDTNCTTTNITTEIGESIRKQTSKSYTNTSWHDMFLNFFNSISLNDLKPTSFISIEKEGGIQKWYYCTHSFSGAIVFSTNYIATYVQGHYVQNNTTLIIRNGVANIIDYIDGVSTDISQTVLTDAIITLYD